MYDGDGSQITRDFYTKMIKLGGKYDNAAAPLHYAIKQMRKRGAGPERWAIFIHVGA
jgi:hypothetical protein